MEGILLPSNSKGLTQEVRKGTGLTCLRLIHDKVHTLQEHSKIEGIEQGTLRINRAKNVEQLQLVDTVLGNNFFLNIHRELKEGDGQTYPGSRRCYIEGTKVD